MFRMATVLVRANVGKYVNMYPKNTQLTVEGAGLPPTITCEAPYMMAAPPMCKRANTR